MNVATFRFLGNVPAEQVTRDHYLIEAELARQKLRSSERASEPLITYIKALERVWRRRSWVPGPDFCDEESILDAKYRLARQARRT